MPEVLSIPDPTRRARGRGSAGLPAASPYRSDPEACPAMDTAGLSWSAPWVPAMLLGWSCLRDEPVSLATARATGTVRLVAIPAESLLALLASGTPGGRTTMRRLFGVAALHLAAAREQMFRQEREGVITAG